MERETDGNNAQRETYTQNEQKYPDYKGLYGMKKM